LDLIFIFKFSLTCNGIYLSYSKVMMSLGRTCEGFVNPSK
jgi:hypothetical protein